MARHPPKDYIKAMRDGAPNLESFDGLLAWEREQEERYEFVGGILRMMVGSKIGHNRIVANLMRDLGNALRGSSCSAFSQDVKVIHSGSFTYPDVVVTCERAPDDTDFVAEPVLIIEVLSKSTERFDRGVKLQAYKNIASLRYVLLIAQDKLQVELHARSDSAWLPPRIFAAPDDRVELPELGLRISLADAYEDTDVLRALG